MSLLNKQAVRAYILGRVKTHRPGWDASRVADAVYSELEFALKKRIDDGIHRHPTIGKTVMEIK